VSRALLAVGAVVVLAWLAVMERDTRLQARSAAALKPGASPALMRRGEADLRRARLLNPDPQPRIDGALLLRARGKTSRSIAGMEAILRDEPDNLTAWGILAVLARGTDATAFARAQAAARRLDPIRTRRARRASP
jgi:hypothetical protein